MKKITLLFCFAVAALVLGAVGQSASTVPADGAAAAGKTLYTCGMHPEIIQDHPGNCPICGMKLTPIRRLDAAGTNASVPGAIAIDPVTIQNMNLRTAEITRGPLRKTIRTVGVIDYNETAVAEVTTKFRGWIEKLYVDATGQLVHRGEPMFEVYSPELYSAEVEYTLALKQTGTNDADATGLRETAANKLKFYDISDAQIHDLEKTRVPLKTLRVVAPMDGFVTEKLAVQGQMVDTGMKLYRLADLGIVWVYAQIYEQDLPYIKLGQEAVVTLSSLPGREFRGRVTFVYPNVDEKTRTARVRLEFENPGYFLKPGMFVLAQINTELAPSVLLVPESAVLRSGSRDTVFITSGNGKFDARTVVLGRESEDGLCQVLSGLNEGERVVTSGQFMLDSESQLREAIQKMQGAPVPTAGTGMPMASTNMASPIPPTNTPAGPLVYVCPMPEHVSITYDHPGACPICGMALVPVTPAELKQLIPGGKVLYYTCPMPEHGAVHEDKPGKCPLCGMTLIPMMAPAVWKSPGATNASTVPNVMAKEMYTCPMHPDVLQDHPGKCPECNMDLVPVAP